MFRFCVELVLIFQIGEFSLGGQFCSDFVLNTLLNISISFTGIVTHGVLSGSALQVLIQLANSIYQIMIRMQLFRNIVDWMDIMDLLAHRE